ncbi:hypothetical protein CSA56_14695 [candidate division KSB3 bacterium]|uniref:Cyclic nucleotide-binding domain-containing protein n=1 Tax=candidate division KSB3 bacterium TaxID=2044937 RepID=A0A2G6KAC3_9BACT|nr:MAG: hypothetical protein CSA56_14695 [candidate division KSB3 bacterium]
MPSTNLLDQLQACPFFASLQETDLQLLLHYGKLNIFSEGKTVHNIGEQSMDMFFLILSGEIAIITGTGKVLQQMGRGDLVSDLDVSLLMNGKTGVIQAVRPTEIFVWYVGVIQKHLPVFMKRLMELT